MKKATATRRLYKFEDEALCKGVRTQPMHKLQALARRIWKAEHKRGHRCPTVKAGRGVYHCGKLVSYCERNSLIVLSRQQRIPVVLVHEMTHALGHHTHGVGFVRRYFELLVRYLGYDREQLAITAAWYNIKVQSINH